MAGRWRKREWRADDVVGEVMKYVKDTRFENNDHSLRFSTQYAGAENFHPARWWSNLIGSGKGTAIRFGTTPLLARQSHCRAK